MKLDARDFGAPGPWAPMSVRDVAGVRSRTDAGPELQLTERDVSLWLVARPRYRSSSDLAVRALASAARYCCWTELLQQATSATALA